MSGNVEDLALSSALSDYATLAGDNAISGYNTISGGSYYTDAAQFSYDTFGLVAHRAALGLAATDLVEFGRILLPAGGTAPGTAPLKLTTQAAPLATVEQGTFELVGNSLQFTQLLKRRGVAMSQSVRVADLTVSNTTAESAAIISAEHGPAYLEVGKCEEIVIRGYMSQRNNVTAFGTLRIKYAGVTIQSIITPASTTMSNVPFELSIALTVRSTGATGTARIDSIMHTGAAVAIDPGAGNVVTIDTTSAENTEVTFQWNEANVANVVVFTQARVLCIEPNR